MLASFLLASAISAGTWVTYDTSFNDSDGKDRSYQIDVKSIVRRGDKVYANSRIRFTRGSSWQPKVNWSMTADCKRKTFSEHTSGSLSSSPYQWKSGYWWNGPELRYGVKGKSYEGQEEEAIRRSRLASEKFGKRKTKAWEFLCEKQVSSWW